MEGNLWQTCTGVSIEKAEVLWVGQQKKYLGIDWMGRNWTKETALYIRVEHFAGTAMEIRRIIKLGRVRGGKWKG